MILFRNMMEMATPLSAAFSSTLYNLDSGCCLYGLFKYILDIAHPHIRLQEVKERKETEENKSKMRRVVD